MKDRAEDIPLEPLGVTNPHQRSKECPLVSGRVHDKCPYLSSSAFKIEMSVNLVGNITLKPLWVVYHDFRNQEHTSMSGRVPDKCPDISFKVKEIEWSVIYYIDCIL